MSEPAYSPSLQQQADADRIKPSLAFGAKLSAHTKNPKAWQNALRKKLKTLIGLDDLESRKRVPLKPRSLWKREHPLGTIEKWILTSEAHSDMPVYFCLPKSSKWPVPAVICLQGHSSGMHNSIAVNAANEMDPIHVDGDRDFAFHAMKRGFAALCLEQRAFGERAEKAQVMRGSQTCHDAVMRALLLGRTLAGERVFDVDRALDFLSNRKEIDIDQTGIMGNSGGGTISIYSAALLPRIKFSMPSCSFCTFRDSIFGIHHCADNYLPGMLHWAESEDIAGLIAPKPLVIVNGVKDDIFPIVPARKAFAGVRKIYRAFKAEKNCRFVEGPEGHRFYADLAWPVLLEIL
ncbi:MAG: acetylxylan esterase [Spirochaetia bacterium]|nr:acetylxylan esterase [Spirochaetia bacterium]